MVQAIRIAAQEESDDAVLKNFVDLVEMAPKMVKAHLHATMELMLKVFVAYFFQEANNSKT